MASPRVPFLARLLLGGRPRRARDEQGGGRGPSLRCPDLGPEQPVQEARLRGGDPQDRRLPAEMSCALSGQIPRIRQPQPQQPSQFWKRRNAPGLECIWMYPGTISIPSSALGTASVTMDLLCRRHASRVLLRCTSRTPRAPLLGRPRLPPRGPGSARSSGRADLGSRRCWRTWSRRPSGAGALDRGLRLLGSPILRKRIWRLGCGWAMGVRL